jgi:hypothetical protein
MFTRTRWNAELRRREVLRVGHGWVPYRIWPTWQECLILVVVLVLAGVWVKWL